MEKGGYPFTEIEAQWQKYWETEKTFRAVDGITPDGKLPGGKPKYYILDMFPYPSGQGLHVGHPEGYTASDIIARYKRMKGFNVLHPFGWDAFGLPAEQYAIQTGTHPAVTTQKNIDNMRRQVKSLGFSYDWDRQVDTTDIRYYKWTQWIFLKLFNSWFDEDQQKARPIEELPIPEGLSESQRDQYINDRRLAYEAFAPVNWCPELGTVLANEEVVGGVSERGGYPVIRKPMRQWMLRITQYAERLLKGLDLVDWPESIRKLQKDWIGRSVGASVDFQVDGHEALIRIFTTRPDTLFGATYMVLAPEHPLVDAITTDVYRADVDRYRQQAARKSDLDRTDLAKDKTGQFTGAYAVNPVNEGLIPIWISDYVLISYGTGAIMAVPAHDERDLEFAKKFDLPIIAVVKPEFWWLVANRPDLRKAETVLPPYELNKRVLLFRWLDQLGSSLTDEEGEAQLNNFYVSHPELFASAYADDGIAINSGSFNGLSTAEFKTKITDWLAEKGLGKQAVCYKLRDWLFSRQRYWGEPFPIIHTEDDKTIALSEQDLPLGLPEAADYKPTGTGEPPLAKVTDWVNVTLPDGRKGKRETNTMPQWAGSCWYYLRYLDPLNERQAVAPEKEKYWMPVDLYIGGAEHAVLHLMYSRFWHHLLYDLGFVSTPEPFKKLINQGMILGEDNQKMSKSRGNVINPDKVIADYGADSMRLYEMFMGPLEATKPWSMQGVEGVHRFLNRLWRVVIDDATGQLSETVQPIPMDEETQRLLHQTIQKVGEDIETFGFNTAISQMMIFVNHLSKLTTRPREAVESLVLVLAPFAPHISEELWQRLGHPDSLAYVPWPAFDPARTRARTVELVVQVFGKIKDRIVVDADADAATIEAAALASEKVQAALAGKPVKKAIVVQGRLVNLVV